MTNPKLQDEHTASRDPILPAFDQRVAILLFLLIDRSVGSLELLGLDRAKGSQVARSNILTRDTRRVRSRES